MTEQDLYPSLERTRAMTARIDRLRRLSQQQRADLEMLGRYIDIFSDEEDESAMDEDQKTAYQIKRMMRHGLRSALDLIEFLIPEPCQCGD